MCWSAEVSAAFAVVEWTGIVWLCRRNALLDRPFALALSPIAAQEALQWLLWEHIAVSVNDCDRVNVFGSLLIRQIVGIVPLGWVWFAQRESPKRRLSRLLLGLTITFVVLRNAMMVPSFMFGPAHCTTIGPGHHQAWPPYLEFYDKLQPALDVIFFSLYWMLPVGSLLLLLRPLWLASAIALITVGTMVPCILSYSPDEVGSVWCWSCSLLLGIALVHPFVQRHLKK